MDKRNSKELDIKKFLKKEGFVEVKETDKQTEWYKVASQRPVCFKNDLNDITRKPQEPADGKSTLAGVPQTH